MPVTSPDQVEAFEKLTTQLSRMEAQFTELSKKKPNDVVNTFKIALVNNLLEVANGLLEAEERPFPDFKAFDVDATPTNSDVLIILNQYAGALRRFKAANTKKYIGSMDRFWVINGERSDIEA